MAPATARLIGSYAAGIASDLLTSVLLATRAPVLLCPAMHTEMWEHPAVQDNLALLRRRGVHVLEPDRGASGRGRRRPGSAAPSRKRWWRRSRRYWRVNRLTLVEAGDAARLEASLAGPTLRGVKAVVSAGGTREPIDPVRYIGNRSSGKQGYAIAAELQARGAEVVLVSSSPMSPPPDVQVVGVETAAEMADAVLREAEGADVVVMAAAVARTTGRRLLRRPN